MKGTKNNEYWCTRFFIGYESDIKFKKNSGEKGIKLKRNFKLFLFRRIYKNKANGGKGAVREICDLIYNAKRKKIRKILSK